MMCRIRIVFVALLTFVCLGVHAQEGRLFWEGSLNYFFENNEYERSHFLRPNTTGGIWVTGTAGYAWDGNHSLRASVMGLKRQGMPEVLNAVEVSAYYQYQNDRFRFRIGALPNRDVMKRYNDFFFTDSLRYHRPLFEGFTLEFRQPEVYDATIWFDWSGMATERQRESFQVGATARGMWRMLFADAKLRYFHYAGFNPAVAGSGVRDHGMVEGTLGLRGRHEWGGLTYEVGTGVLVGLEQDRSQGYAEGNFGWLSRLALQAYGFGTENTLYIGEPHFGLYPEWENQLYWGNQFLRGGKYLQSKWYIQFIKGRGIDLRLAFTMHYSEGQLFHRQGLTATIDVPQGKWLKGRHKSLFPWLALFR